MADASKLAPTISEKNYYHSFVPPYILDGLSESPTASEEIKKAAEEALEAARQVYSENILIQTSRGLPQKPTKDSGVCGVTIFDGQHKKQRVQQRSTLEGQSNEVSADKTVNRMFDQAQAILDFKKTVLGIRSIDNACHDINITVHYENRLSNAYWNNNVEEWFIGDGDGALFGSFATEDVLSHELAHGTTTYQNSLAYENQSGALNEHASDVFGIAERQKAAKQTATENAHWLIGAEIMLDWIDKDGKLVRNSDGTLIPDSKRGANPAPLMDYALRTFKNEKAYKNHPLLAAQYNTDPQPKHMNNYVNLPNTQAGDWGGVHINSGIPNHAFYLAATSIGGNVWENTFLIWFGALEETSKDCTFKKFAELTIKSALKLETWKDNNPNQKTWQNGNTVKKGDAAKVAKAWEDVGVLTADETKQILN